MTRDLIDSDMTPSSSAQFQILHNRRVDLNCLMAKFHHGAMMLALGVDGSGGRQMCCGVVWEFE